MRATMFWAVSACLLGCLPEPATNGPAPRRLDAAAAPADARPDATPTLDAALGAPDAGPGGCLACHRGVEPMHPASPLACVDCHGGDPDGRTQEAAHPPRPEGLAAGAIRRLATDALDALDPDLLRFVNPGDLRVADRGCGAGNPQAAEGGCHQPIVERARRSVMQTYVGHYTLPRFLAGLQGRDGIYAAVAVDDPGFDPTIEGSVPRLEPLRTPVAPMEASAGAVLDRYLPQQCPWCHTASFGRNDAPRNYRSSGCSACHVLYADDGLARGGDPTIDPTRPPHPIAHQLTTAIPTAQCERCHYQGARIGLSFQGIREGGFAEEPPRAIPLGEPAHGHGPGFYLVDEDEASARDETPPDIHFERGMHCVDCHTAREVHGDGRLHSAAKGQLDVTCTDCHGTVRAPAAPGPDGVFRTARHGSPLRQLERDAEGAIWLVGRVDGARHPVTQIAALLTGPRAEDPNLQAAMGLDADGVSHTDTMECWTCHTAWRPSCFGCHVTLDERHEGRDEQSGALVPGLATGGRAFQALDFLALGVNGRGRIDTLCPSMQVFFSWIDAEGSPRMEGRVRETAAGQLGYGWMPTFAHTIRPQARPCTQCHLDDLEENRARVEETFGFGGPGRGFVIEDDAGRAHDLTAARDADGAPTVAFPHRGSGLVPMAIVERALSVRIATGRERCNGEDDDGDGEIDEGFRLGSDPAHCGACGNACPGPAPVCSVSRCLARIWVSPQGDDVSGDGSREAPWRTIPRALADPPGPTRLLLLPGVHRVDVLDVPPEVEIEGAGLSRDDVILEGRLRFADGAGGVDQISGAVRRLTLRAPVEVRRQVLQLFDVVFLEPRGAPAALDAEDASVGVIQCEVRGATQTAVRARGGSVRLLRTRFDRNAVPDGAALIEHRGGGRLILSNTVVHDTDGATLTVAEGTRLSVTLTTFSDGRGDVVTLGPDAGAGLVANSIFAGTTGRAFVVDPTAAPPTLSTNLIWDQRGPEAEPAALPHPGRRAADPRFVDPAAGDLHLAAGSAALDVGDPIYVTDTDLEQRPRPQGPGFDLGAYERAAE